MLQYEIWRHNPSEQQQSALGRYFRADTSAQLELPALPGPTHGGFASPQVTRTPAPVS